MISSRLVSVDFILLSHLDILGVKDKLKEVARKVLDSLKVTSEKFRAEVMKAIKTGKLKLTDLKRRIQEILASLQTKDQNTIDDRK